MKPLIRLRLVSLVSLLLFFRSPHIAGQELRRRVSLGAETIPADSQVVIGPVRPGGTAQTGDLRAGDVILRIGDAMIAGSAALDVALRKYRANDRTTFVIERAGARLARPVIFQPKPFERSSDFEVRYEIVRADNIRYRAIVTKPPGVGPFPAMLLIGGAGCYSLDDPPTDDPYRQLLYALTRRGFVTMRVEKSGEGDSEGPPCESAAANLSVAIARSVAGLQALAGYAFVTPQRVFILAHGIGPLEAALVAQEVPVAGVIAAETLGTDLFSYKLPLARVQLLLSGASYDSVESEVRVLERCNARFYLDKQTPTTLAREAPECPNLIRIETLSYTYLQQIADVNLAQTWKTSDMPVLVIYGTSDPSTDEVESRYLVDMINSFRSGRATYLQIEGMNYFFDREPSKRDGLLVLIRRQQRGEFDSTLIEGIESWVDRVIR